MNNKINDWEIDFNAAFNANKLSRMLTMSNIDLGPDGIKYLEKMFVASSQLLNYCHNKGLTTEQLFKLNNLIIEVAIEQLKTEEKEKNR